METSLSARAAGTLAAIWLSGCGGGLASEQAESAAGALGAYQVGAGKPYASLQALVDLLEPGDVVEVYGGLTYLGGVRFTRPGREGREITIRGVAVDGRRPVLSGATTTVEFAANHYVFEGFEVTSGTSRCVFHHAHDVTIRDTVIHDCPAHGLLGADEGSGSLVLEHSEVYGAGGGDRLHQIYMATDETAYPGAVFRMQHCYVHGARGGNNVKSRAQRNEIYYNWIEGAYYHELELIGPDGQNETLAREDSDVVGNVLYQGYASRTHFPIRVGGDGTGQTFGRYRFANNTIVLGQATTSAVFRVFDGIESIEMYGNVLFRLGGGPVTVLRDLEAEWKHGPTIAGDRNWVSAGSVAVPPSWNATLTGSDPGFTDIHAKNPRPTAQSPLCDAGGDVVLTAPSHPLPSPERARFEPPLHALRASGRIAPRPVVGALDLGAYECSTSP